MQFNAPKRLRATVLDRHTEAAHVTTAKDQPEEITARFDNTRDEELKTLQQALRRKAIIFRLDTHHLFHKTNAHEIDNEIQLILEIMHGMGHQPRILPGVMNQPRYAIKCNTDLILQRIEFNLRLFFYV